MRFALACGALACGTQGAAVTQTSTPTSELAAADVICAAVDDGALAVFDGAACPWVLLAEDAGQRLVLSSSVESGAERAESLSVRAPPPCVDAPGICRWEGTQSALGPALLAIVEGPESEHPVDLWFGIALGGEEGEEGEEVVFADLWWGEASVVDYTEVGPIHTLAPHECGGSLVLLPRPRLPEATYAAPDPELIKRAGAYSFSVQEDMLVRTGAAPESEECKPLWSELP